MNTIWDFLRAAAPWVVTGLLAAAEREAVQRCGKYVFADTFSFQAPAFYENNGYQEVFVLEGYPYTGKRHYYKKL